MIQFLVNFWEPILTMCSIISFIFLPYSKIFKPTDYNGKGMFTEGYTKAEKEILKGKDPAALFEQCPGVVDNWDRGWVQACSDYRKIKSNP